MTHQPAQTMDLQDYVTELTRPHSHREHYAVREAGAWQGRDHVTRVDSLVDQLLTNDTPSAVVESGTRPGFASKPAARLDAIDTLIRIDVRASDWLAQLGEADAGDTATTIRRLAAKAAGLTPCTAKKPFRECCIRHDIEHEVRRWWTWARIVTGWDSPAWTPNATCPACAERGTLKVRLNEQIGTCVNDACRATWDPSTIGILADHISVETATAKVKPQSAGPCWCPVPQPDVADLSFLCARCGSAWCRHAVYARLVHTSSQRTA